MNGQIDWNEMPEAHVFKSDVTGLRKEEVKVEIGDGRVLQISGERNVGREEINNDEAAAVQRVECSSGKFTRSFTLPMNAKMDQVRAAVENGVLIVTVPKDEAKQAVESSN
ncbi:18.1 kDa class I heat shock protein-like [Lotus japonicus]|uniref:18.1 kDa class I heat shock protein-like n=1 Tax=Lotus japonicus TaxID=34305 RepID=UPI00258E0A69|nr:18.1 kDa class I heat shock protein-like [Lotus japonicus]